MLVVSRLISCLLYVPLVVGALQVWRTIVLRDWLVGKVSDLSAAEKSDFSEKE